MDGERLVPDYKSGTMRPASRPRAAEPVPASDHMAPIKRSFDGVVAMLFDEIDRVRHEEGNNRRVIELCMLSGMLSKILAARERGPMLIEGRRE